MLWIFAGILFAVAILLFITNDFYYRETSFVFVFLGAIPLVIGICLLADYNYNKLTLQKKIIVLEENNKTVIQDVEPYINKYLDYESNTINYVSNHTSAVVALSLYPELKGNEFIMEQLRIIVDNNKEIKTLKLKEAELDSFKIWLFVKGSEQEYERKN